MRVAARRSRSSSGAAGERLPRCVGRGEAVRGRGGVHRGPRARDPAGHRGGEPRRGARGAAPQGAHGELDAARTELLVRQFAIEYHGTANAPARFVAVAVQPVLERAAGLVGAHGLRAYDGVQLAAGLAARDVDGALSFCAFDRALTAAARDEGFTLALT